MMEKQTWTSKDWDAWDKNYRRYLMNALSGPKPLFLMGTQNEHGGLNLGLFSNVVHVGAHPPALGILFRPTNTPRHSLQNVIQNQVATLNLVSSSFLAQAHWCAANFPEDESEFEATQLTPEFLPEWSAPLVKAAHIQLGVRLLETHTLQINQTHLVVLGVEWIRLPQGAVQEDGFLDLHALGAMSANGLDAYGPLGPVVKFKYAKTNRLPETVVDFRP